MSNVPSRLSCLNTWSEFAALFRGKGVDIQNLLEADPCLRKYTTEGRFDDFNLVPRPLLVYLLLARPQYSCNNIFPDMWMEAKTSLCFLSCLWWLWFIVALEEMSRDYSLIPIYWVSDARNGSEKSKFAFKGVSKGCVHFQVNTPDVFYYRTVSFFVALL